MSIYSDRSLLLETLAPHVMTCLNAIEIVRLIIFYSFMLIKTEVVICAPAGLVSKVQESLGSFSSSVKFSVKQLGVTSGTVSGPAHEDIHSFCFFPDKKYY